MLTLTLPASAARTADGRLVIGGCALDDLAAEYGTPLYVYDEAELRTRLRRWREVVATWPAGGEVRYSAKAYFGLAMARLCVEEGCGVDVVSGGELEIALRAGVPAEQIAFPGSNKSAAEVALARTAGIGHLVVDSLHELDLVAAEPALPAVAALLRLSPGVQPDTHAGISTGQLDSKFGFTIADGGADHALATAMSIPGLDVEGVHIHVGSQLFDSGAVRAAATVVARWLGSARRRNGFVARTVSLGGGLGVAHLATDRPPDVHEFMSELTTTFAQAAEGEGIELPRLHVEPGRSVAGPAGVAVYTVGARKEIAGVRTFVAVDGGMADNPRPQLYGARYEAVPVLTPSGRDEERITLVGRYCESTDVLIPEITLPRLLPGDLLAVPAAGAYTVSMASTYNSVPRPAVVFVRGGDARLVRRRETVDDLLACELG